MLPPLSIQTLPPECAHLCLEVERFVEDELGIALTGKTLLVALSGGMDSTVLLVLAACLARKSGGRAIAAHLNHGLRPEARDEAAKAAAFCRAVGVPCVLGASGVARYAAKQSLGLEEAGRLLRYRFLDGARKRHHADFLLTAHHLDDLAEDVMLRLTRGTGWPELAGMTAWDTERRLLRPLLLTPRRSLTLFAERLGLSWSEDSSNSDPRYKRNRIRHSLMPLIMEENPKFPEAVARLWRLARVDGDFWEREVSSLLPSAVSGTLVIGGAETAPLPRALRLRLYKKALERLGRGQPLADSLLRLDAAFIEGRIGASFQFPGGKTARLTKGGIVFRAANPAQIPGGH